MSAYNFTELPWAIEPLAICAPNLQFDCLYCRTLSPELSCPSCGAPRTKATPIRAITPSRPRPNFEEDGYEEIRDETGQIIARAYIHDPKP